MPHAMLGSAPTRDRTSSPATTARACARHPTRPTPRGTPSAGVSNQRGRPDAGRAGPRTAARQARAAGPRPVKAMVSDVRPTRSGVVRPPTRSTHPTNGDHQAVTDQHGLSSTEPIPGDAADQQDRQRQRRPRADVRLGTASQTDAEPAQGRARSQPDAVRGKPGAVAELARRGARPGGSGQAEAVRHGYPQAVEALPPADLSAGQ